MDNIQERILILKQMHQCNITFVIEDLVDEKNNAAGTMVVFEIKYEQK